MDEYLKSMNLISSSFVLVFFEASGTEKNKGEDVLKCIESSKNASDRRNNLFCCVVSALRRLKL